MSPQGFGASHPVSDNSTEAGRALNRRVEMQLVK
jgi:outer membrane protein OmpA-like peptidoglycan-associated protein